MPKPIYALEPFYGGSHRLFLESLQRRVIPQLQILPMSPHHWKWRMHGSAVYYADLFESQQFQPGLILASDFVHLSALRGLISQPDRWRWVLYFHENQLTYPFREKHPGDLTYAHMNIQSALAADLVYFNSGFHLDNFINAIPQFYAHFVDYKPGDVAERIRRKSSVLPLGLDLCRFDHLPPPVSSSGPGIILWNQRWEHDKNPELFFQTLFHLAEDQIPFRLIVCGEEFSDSPAIFAAARSKLGEHILHWGYIEKEQEYARLLRTADIVVSTAWHEFFGIAVLEAMYCGCYPLLPKRLVYPEYIPLERRQQNLYTSDRDLYRKLKFALTRIDQTRQIQFREEAARFDWPHMAPRWRRALHHGG